MQKRVRKNSDYICAKKPKLDIAVNNEQEKINTNTMSAQYGHSKEMDIKSDSLIRSASSVECSELSDVNIVDKSPIMNANIKTFSKSDSDAVVEFKEVFQKILQADESEDHVHCSTDVTTSGSSSNNVCSGSMHFQDNSEMLQDSVLNTKLDTESLESLSNYKLLQRENDILLDFDTNSTLESTNNHGVADGNSICIQNENDLFLTDGSNTKDSIIIQKSVESLADTKSNPPPPAKNSLSLCNAPPLEMNAANEKKKSPPDQTAKVSIGNTTISVPLLKPLNFRGIINNEGKSVSKIVRKVINIRGKKIKAPTIVQLSPVQMNRKPTAKIVQATLVGNKIQLPNIGFKSSGNYIKSNMVQTSPMTVSSLPKQIFEDEMVFLENTPQSQSQPTSEYELKPIENNPPVASINTQPSTQPKETNGKTVPFQELVPKSSPSYMTQFCVVENDSNAPPKSFESIITDSLPTSITVTSSGENALPKVSASVSKPRKPIMLTKTDVSSGTSVGDIIRASNPSGETNNLSKDNHQNTDTTAIGKMLEDNFLLRKQIALAVQNCNRFQLKVTKSTDDNKGKRNEIAIGQPKRQMTKLGPIMAQNSTNDTVLVTNMDNVQKSNTLKSDETQNVLLKHLLQSSINQRSNQTCNQSLAPRKLATLRAPSLGVVSSLEAQLARPGIPPVSAVNDIKPELNKLPPKVANDKPKKHPMDREPVKSRPEMISRETSFVSTFSPKPKVIPSPSEIDNRTPSAHTTTTQVVETTDNAKQVAFQPTPTNSNYNSINLFKFFKQKEETKTNQHQTSTIELISNQNQVQNKTHSPDVNSDIKLATNNEYDQIVHDAAAGASLSTAKTTKTDIEQNIEIRKKFKRDYQKHKRQMLFNKEPQNHQKKKSRKLSKASEDFDEFIENKVVQMKQMFVLEVLEPFLSTFLGICSIYGYNDKIKNHIDYTYHNVFKEDFGRTNLKNFVDFYSTKPYGPCTNNKETSVPSFQNKFYDEEFSTMNHQTCDRLYQLINTLKHQHLQSSENISLTSRSPCNGTTSQSHHNMNYPGIKYQKHFNLNVDRMSPVIPMINPSHFGVIKKKKPGQASRNKCSYGNMETTVILTLSSFVAENILEILRDLENLLNIYSPISHKLLNNDNKINVRNIKGLYLSRLKNLQKTETTNIQNFLNGTYKCCRNCHLTIICGIVGADSNSNIKKRIMADSHFCDKFCCIQYKKKGRKFVVSRKRERLHQNNKAVNRISANENNCCNNSSNYKVVGPNCFWKPSYKGTSNEDVNDTCLKMRIAITLNTSKDTRRCILCNQKGDTFTEGSSRLLNYDVNKWVHLNCALWSNSVYETINGGLMNLELTMQQGLHQICTFCNQYGASIKCFKMRCTHIYHLPCAIKEQCVFYKNKTIHCASHAHRMEKKNELNSIRVRRRVYIERDENRQVAAVMHHLELSNLLRIGNLTFINVGQLLPHQLEAFHTPNYIYPIGYKIVRFFWSMKKLNKRCRYICSIAETNGRPEFVIQIQEQFENDVELRDISPKAVWQRVLEKIVQLRKGQSLVQLFTEYFSGEDLFGLSEPSIVRILESLPGVESLTDYRFKYGRNPLLELPLALNPSGSARTEPKQKHIINWKKAHTQRTSSINLKLTLSPSSLVAGEVACPYSKQFVHSKSSQYRKMKQEWRNNVYLARSKIQGLGLYAARDLEKHTMVIEYIGQVIRTEVSELREKQYDLRNRGIYMFRLDEERVVDATLSGGLARYINHSCNPNCVTEIVDVDREYRIIIFAKRRINKGEELSYDYKFDIEDDAHKISCMCEAPNCRKWMN